MGPWPNFTDEAKEAISNFAFEVLQKPEPPLSVNTSTGLYGYSESKKRLVTNRLVGQSGA